MYKIGGVNFSNTFKIYDFNIIDLSLDLGDFVIVETENGLQIGVLKYIKDSKNECLANVVRKATSEDLIKFEDNKINAKKSLDLIKKEVNNLNIDMNVLDCNYNFDLSHLVIYFTAPERVDFRNLAKKLATKLKTRVEFHQIGIRDKARLVGGYGPCGLSFCCYTFLNEISGININMAKNQRLALNPSKINGVCGRLLCCLSYEDELYHELGKDIPAVGTKVKYNGKEGKVISADVLNKKYIFITNDKEIVEVNDIE